MKHRVIEIIQNSPFSNNWSTSPAKEGIDITTKSGLYNIKMWPDQEKVKVVREGVIHDLTGLSKGRWVSLDDFKVWLQEQASHMGESKFPKFSEYCLKEAAPAGTGAFEISEDQFAQLFPQFNNKFAGRIDTDHSEIKQMIGAGDINLHHNNNTYFSIFSPGVKDASDNFQNRPHAIWVPINIELYPSHYREVLDISGGESTRFNYTGNPEEMFAFWETNALG
jgi:hypothetical protein